MALELLSFSTTVLQASSPVDPVLDFAPPVAARSTPLESAVATLRFEGRVSLMGFNNFSLPDMHVVGGSIVFNSKLMYMRRDIMQFVKMLERGLFPKGKVSVETKAFGVSSEIVGYT